MATSKSIDPSGPKGVTMAVRHVPKRGERHTTKLPASSASRADERVTYLTKLTAMPIVKLGVGVDCVARRAPRPGRSCAIERIVANRQSLARSAEEDLLVRDQSGQTNRVNPDAVDRVGAARARRSS